jgi:hypothetical protein
LKFAAGTVEISSRITHAQLDFNFAVLHARGHNLRAAVCEAHDEFPGFAKELCSRLSTLGFIGCSRAMEDYFRAETYSLKSLFRDERKRIVSQIVDTTLADIDKLYGDVYEHNASLIGFLRELALPLPPILRVSSEFVLSNAIRRSLSSEKLDFERLQLLIETAGQTGIALDHSAKLALRERLGRTMNRWSIDPFELQTLSELDLLIPLLRALPFEADFWDAQNTYYELMKAITQLKPAAASDTWLQLFRNVGDNLGIAVPHIFRVSANEKKLADDKELSALSVPQQPQFQVGLPAE